MASVPEEGYEIKLTISFDEEAFMRSIKRATRLALLKQSVSCFKQFIKSFFSKDF